MRQLPRPHRRGAILLALLGVVLALPVLARPAESDGASQPYERRYAVKQLSLHEAEVLAWQQCGAATKEVCRVRDSGIMESGIQYLVFIGDDAAQERLVRALAERDGMPRSQAFQVILLTADRAAKESLEGLPANTRKAIEDVASFLPFTRYRLVDAGWVRTANQAALTLHDADGLPLEVSLTLRGRANEQLLISPFVVDAQAVDLSSVESPTGKAVRRAGRRLLGTSFGIQLGETLVVGTSRVDGSESALVAVVSAAP